MSNVTGIYKIENLKNGKIYIGQSYNISYRWIHHKSDLRGGIHHNKHLQNAWNKYGEDNFSFEILEECERELLNSREQYWINYYDSFNNGYNFDNGGNGVYGYKHTEEEINKMRLIQNPICVLQFDLDFNFVNKYIGGVSHIKKELGYTKEVITARCEKLQKTMTPYKESYWVYEQEYINPNFSWDKYLNNIPIINYSLLKTDKKQNVLKICQYTLDRKLIKVWNSYKELKENGFNTSQISGICNQSRGKRTCNGYIWCFEGYDFSDGYFDILDVYKNNGTEKRKRKVIMIDKITLEEIMTFESITSAANYVGVGCSNILVAIKNNKTSGGYRWKYA